MANSCMLFSTSQSRSQSPRSSWSAPTNERLQVHCVWLKKTIALPEFVPLASSSAATIPLEPTTIEDKRPMTIDVSTIKELNAAQTEYLVLEHASKLREIFEGKKYCRRHEDYKKGGKTRGDLAFQVHFGPFSEEQQDKIMEVLTNMFCCGHSEVMKLHSVLLIRLVVLGSSYCPKFRCHRKYVNIAR
ncbi:uncharacterized protein LOC122951733 isoform X2 [Acropora millepora]|uniref:uncharacterized protein LOC122951733 isoform X2 n=1 Tax=Acropora millepora TaxID=45264 RepID=UPI001CF5E91C|nr:uncharacterized protein LOC122951733 isoform X2 [Acropora millepora]